MKGPRALFDLRIVEAGPSSPRSSVLSWQQGCAGRGARTCTNWPGHASCHGRARAAWQPHLPGRGKSFVFFRTFGPTPMTHRPASVTRRSSSGCRRSPTNRHGSRPDVAVLHHIAPRWPPVGAVAGQPDRRATLQERRSSSGHGPKHVAGQAWLSATARRWAQEARYLARRLGPPACESLTVTAIAHRPQAPAPRRHGATPGKVRDPPLRAAAGPSSRRPETVRWDALCAGGRLSCPMGGCARSEAAGRGRGERLDGEPGQAGSPARGNGQPLCRGERLGTVVPLLPLVIISIVRWHG